MANALMPKVATMKDGRRINPTYVNGLMELVL